METNTLGVASATDGSAHNPIPTQNTARGERVARATRKLHDLLETREELRGVYAPADHLAETLRWSA